MLTEAQCKRKEEGEITSTGQVSLRQAAIAIAYNSNIIKLLKKIHIYVLVQIFLRTSGP